MTTMTPESLARDTYVLFSLPEAALRINELIDQPQTTTEELADVILTDPALSARLLRLVNSAYYARQTPADTVAVAISRIGFTTLRDLVMTTAMIDVFPSLPPEQINMEQFWFHAVACGVSARELDERLCFKGGEQLFLAGLLHGIGRLVFFSRCPQAYLKVLQRIETEGLSTQAAEEAVFGFNYAQLGGELLRCWHFPERIQQAVTHHLDPQAAGRFRREAELINAAEKIAEIVQEEELKDPLRRRRPDKATATEASTEAAPAMQEIAKQLGLDPDQAVTIPFDISERVVEMFEVLVPGASMVW
jgi:HD-like signal output (HDOD) protein